MSIAIVFFSGCDIINFEFTLNFIIRPFFYMTKNSKQTFNFKMKRDFKMKKAFFIIFKGISVAKKKNCLRSENAPLIHSGQGLCKNIHSICKLSVRVNDRSLIAVY